VGLSVIPATSVAEATQPSSCSQLSSFSCQEVVELVVKSGEHQSSLFQIVYVLLLLRWHFIMMKWAENTYID
jgi:hypothetical protein